MTREMGLTSIVLAGLTLSCSALVSSALGDNPSERMPLWPERAPGAKGEAPADVPTLTAWLPAPDKSTGAAIVICPGGGYGHLATDHEGRQIGEWLNSIGVAGFVLEYRHRGRGYRHPAPLQDVQRAIRMVRAGADRWGLDPKRVGVLGFSAGGHLAATAATQFDAGEPGAVDPIQRVGCRPDVAVLCYPVIAFGEPFTHLGSQRNLLGKDAPAEQVRALSAEKRVTAETPPTFLWSTDEDRGVPPENAVAFYLALRKHRVPAELHVFQRGRHGLGLAQGIAGTEQWPELCRRWLAGQGFLDKRR